MSFKRFDRHKEFKGLEFRLLSNTVSFLTDLHLGFNVNNSLYGLYDGYLYDDLLYELQSAVKENVDELKSDGNLIKTYRVIDDLEAIIKKIKSL